MVAATRLGTEGHSYEHGCVLTHHNEQWKNPNHEMLVHHEELLSHVRLQSVGRNVDDQVHAVIEGSRMQD